MEYAIEVESLGKVYGGREVIADIGFAVPAGTVLGLLGPNGAGKTTTVRILTTLVAPDRGRAAVAGFDVLREPKRVRERIGLSGQYAAVDNALTGEENLILQGRLSRLGRSEGRARAAELIEGFGLVEASRRPVRTYSGGMRRRLDLAASLLSRPSVLFLDEPTTGLDPTSRSVLWELVRGQVSAGVTVLLTTQYLEEADQLADRLVVIDAGRVVAEGSPNELKRKVGAERLDVEVSPGQAGAAAAALAPLVTHPPIVDQGSNRVTVSLDGGVDGIAEAACALRAAGLTVLDFAMRRPSLDEVFFHLTGRPTNKEIAR